MKKFFLILGVLILLAAAYLVYMFKFKSGPKRIKGPEPIPLAVSKHSSLFNNSINTVLTAYYGMTEGFVNWDTVAVTKYAGNLKASLDTLRIDELQKDTIIYQTSLDFLANAKSETNNILQQSTLDKKREALNNLSDNLRSLFITVKYDQGKIYWQECPMAFNEENSGFWLSQTDAVRNPYLGNKHPKYKAEMLECGGPKDTINFMQK